jgi:ABC-type antimicrobial peptide transport system permease subunit
MSAPPASNSAWNLIYIRATISDVATMTWQLALSIGLAGFVVGFASGYGIRAFISFKRYYTAAPRALFSAL